MNKIIEKLSAGVMGLIISCAAAGFAVDAIKADPNYESNQDYVEIVENAIEDKLEDDNYNDKSDDEKVEYVEDYINELWKGQQGE